jgi:Tfp pilus assembly protein PilF
MFGKVGWIAVCLTGLAGCATVPSVPVATQLPWHDEAFAYDATSVRIQQDDLFRLDPELEQTLQDPALQQLSTSRRLDKLVALLYGRGLKPFPYAPGHSTTATQTWQNKRGDCLSLTVLAVSMARALKLEAQMQEVRVPVLFDRRDRVDFLNQHVNVLVRKSSPIDWAESRFQSNDMIVDFEPEVGTNREGHALSDQAILARYYNNVAAEYLSHDQRSLAYAYFKAAIQLEPKYASSYGNLAQLYLRSGWSSDAERLLREAVDLSEDATVHLLSLHQLLLAQGRTQEADYYAQLLKSRRDKDPYYWIGLGLKNLREGEFRQAVNALEKAQALTNGFEDVHRYLAVAYWRAGQSSRANEQLEMLASLHPGSDDVVTLRKKFNSAVH